MLAAVALVFLVGPIMAAVHDAPISRAERQLIVQFKRNAQVEDRESALRNATRIETLAGRSPKAFRAASLGTAPQRIEVEEGVKVESELARLQKNPAVEYVEPNYPMTLFAATNAVFPNDFEFSKMYGLHNVGGSNAKTNADVKAPAAWAFTTGDKNVIVAVIDTGIDYLHQDLKENLWVNRSEIPYNGVDDDANGFVDDYYGYDFVSNDSDPYDDNQHGTHVAGTIGAKGNNGIGTVGMCWDVSMMALKAFDEQGNGTVAEAIAAIHYAVEHGARVINASWGLDERSRALEEATKFAADAGVLIVAAAGNSRWELPSYPASFETVLSVGATDAKDARADFSNYGAYVDVAAPGANIISTLPENSYGYLSGTSMAAPHVSGMAALVLARFPNYNRQELFDILVNSVEEIAFDQPIGRGRIDSSLAVQMDQPLPSASIVVRSNIYGMVEATGTASGSFVTGYRLLLGAGRSPTNWIEIVSSNSRVTNGVLGSFDSALVPDGSAVVQVLVRNENGTEAAARAPVRVMNALITSPASGDIIPPGKHLIRGTIHGEGKTYELSYGAGIVATNWTVLASGGSGIVDGILGEWDASNLPSGHYQLRLVVSDRLGRAELVAPVIYIDRKLRPGWPVYLPGDSDFPTTEWRNVRPADLDGDGAMELVLVDAGTRNRAQTLLVYGIDGTLRWSRELGFDIPPDLPSIGDVDGDGKKEIFVDGTNGIVAFRHDGTVVAGWPVQTAARNHAKVLADLDRDGRLELIAYSQEYAATQVAEMRQLSIYRDNGQLLRTWSLPWCGFTNDVQKIFPSVANLDANADLEIVAPSGCSELLAFDHDRSEPKWRATVTGEILSSPVIGDIDGNGAMDVVVAVAAVADRDPAGVYVFSNEGQRWRGWPVLEDLSFVHAPVLGDLDQDGRLEIVAVNDAVTASVHVLQADGFDADGWPLALSPKTSSRVGLSLGDVNGDKRPDVLVSTPGYPGLAVTLRDSEYLGGISARDISGQVIPLNGVGVLPSIPFESLGQVRFHKGTPVVIEDLDGNGRLDLVFSSIQDRSFGSFAGIKNRSSVYIWELDTPNGLNEWAMFGHDVSNSGAYTLPHSPAPTPTNVTRAIRDRLIVAEDRDSRIEVLTNDWNAKGGALELVSFTQPTNGVVRLDGSAVSYLPSTDFSGLDGFKYTMRDSGGLTSEAQVIIRVKPINDRPTVEDIQLTVRKNSSVDLQYLGADAENDKLNFRIMMSPQHGELWNYPQIGTYYPHKGYSGADVFTYVANDGKLDSLPGTVTITIINSNNPPKALPQAVLTKTNRSVFISPRATDEDDDPLTYELIGSVTNGIVAREGSGFRFTPLTNLVGEGSFMFRAFDGTAFSEAARVLVNVIATNAAPVSSDSSTTVQPNTESKIQLSGSDPDGDQIQFVVLSQPLHGSLSGTPPQLFYTPATNYLGPDRFEFKVSDGFAESEPSTFTIQVARQNRPPVSKDQQISADLGIPVRLLLDASDPDGDSLQSIILKGPAQGLLYGSGTNLTYVPRSDAAGWDVFTYKLWDGQRFGNAARVTMMISPPVEERPARFTGLTVNDEGIVELTLEVPQAKPVTVETSTNLVTWTVLGAEIASSERSMIITDTNTAGGQKFYRAVQP